MATESTPEDNLDTPEEEWLPVGYGAGEDEG